MPTSVSLKKGFVSPQWEKRYDVLSANAAGSFVRALQIPAYNIDASYFCANTTSTIHQYDAICDSYMTLPASGIAGTFGAGACGRVIPLGPTGTFTAGTTTSGTTGLTINRDLRGFKIRITGGPGAGDERIIASNTLGANSVITVTDAFSATITSSSTYRLLTPRLWVFAPAAAPGAGFSLNWVTGVNDAAWTSRSAIQNGRYLYSFRGAAGNVLDVYDIALVTWVSGKAYGGQNEVFTTGNCWEYDGINTIYGAMPTGRLIKFDVLKNEVKPLASQPLYTQGTATVGDKLFRYSFQDGPTRIDFLYFWGNTLTSLTRMLIFQTY